MTTAEGEELKVSWKQSRTVDLVKVFRRHQLKEAELFQGATCTRPGHVQPLRR